jgi:hypothetical protein
MKLLGYGDFDWEPWGFAVGIPPDFLPFPVVEPQVLERPGTTATFGPPTISEMTIPGTALILRENVIGTGNSRIEEAFLYFFKRINPYNPEPRQLRAERNNGTKIAILAVVRIFGRSNEQNRNERFIDFVAVDAAWTDLTTTTTSGTF